MKVGYKRLIIKYLLCSVEAISVLLSDSRAGAEPPPGLPRQSKQIDEGLTDSEEEEEEGESARQTLLGQESCEVTGYEMRGVQLY